MDRLRSDQYTSAREMNDSMNETHHFGADLERLLRIVEAQQYTIAALERRVMNLEAGVLLPSFSSAMRAPPRTNIAESQRLASVASPPAMTPVGGPIGAVGDPLVKHPENNSDVDIVVRGSIPKTSMRPLDDDVTAVDSEQLGRLVESCALDFLRNNTSRRSGAWCTDSVDQPCPSFAEEDRVTNAESSSGDNDPTASNATQPQPPVTTVNVGGESVAVGELLPNRALHYLVKNPRKTGRWCRGHPSTLTPASCSFVHRRTDDQVLVVEGTPVPVSALVRNKAVELLLTHAVGREGQWCESSDATHDVEICYRVHRREPKPQKQPQSSNTDTEEAEPGYVLVADSKVPITDLRPNPAVEYLVKNPTKRGRWCAKAKQHDADSCHFVHPLSSETNEDAMQEVQHDSPPQPRSPTGQCEPDELPHASYDCPEPPRTHEQYESLLENDSFEPTKDSAKCVRVGSRLVPVAELVPNAAVDYLLANPTRRGRWCHGHGKKKVHECTFVHTKSSIEEEISGTNHSDGEATSTSTHQSDAPLRTRMIFFSQPEDPS